MSDVIDTVKNTSTKDENTPKKKPQSRVLLHNDDYTPIQFVLDNLKKHFDKNANLAGQIMMTAHTKGLSLVDIYDKEEAQRRVNAAMNDARKADHGLHYEVEDEDE
jgi:ATP-dependent Clp protease adaptor protein ClpS